MIVMVRADDRLIHGMVAVSWTNFLHPDVILVANDETALDDFKSMTMKMAKPAGVNLVVKTVADSIKALNNPVNDKKQIFVVTESIKDARVIFSETSGYKSLNIGTAGIKRGKEELIQTLPQVFVTKSEFDEAYALNTAGVEVFAQITPSRERMEFKEITNLVQK